MNKILLLTMLLLTASCSDAVSNLDNGLIERNGVELHVGSFPLSTSGDSTVNGHTLLPEAITWWNEQMGRDGIERVVLAEPTAPDEDTDISVEIGFVPGDTEGDEPTGVTDLVWHANSGVIYECHITLSSDFTYHIETMFQALKHELGHCFGLTDDPGPPMTVDLQSIMSDPLDPLGELTDHDFELLLSMGEW